METITILAVDDEPFNLDLIELAFMDVPNMNLITCLLYTSPSPRDRTRSRMPSSA